MIRFITILAFFNLIACTADYAIYPEHLMPYELDHLKSAVSLYCDPSVDNDNRTLSLSIIHIYFPDISENRICSDLLIEVE